MLFYIFLLACLCINLDDFVQPFLRFRKSMMTPDGPNTIQHYRWDSDEPMRLSRWSEGLPIKR